MSSTSQVKYQKKKTIWRYVLQGQFINVSAATPKFGRRLLQNFPRYPQGFSRRHCVRNLKTVSDVRDQSANNRLHGRICIEFDEEGYFNREKLC